MQLMPYSQFLRCKQMQICFFFENDYIYSNSTCRVCIQWSMSFPYIHFLYLPMCMSCRESQILEDTPHCVGWLQVVIFLPVNFYWQSWRNFMIHILLLIFFWLDKKKRIIIQGNEFIMDETNNWMFSITPRVGSYYLNYHNHNHNHK